jgi:uncharacterized protein (TIGR02145 family)
MLKVMQKRALLAFAAIAFASTFLVLPTFADDVDYNVSINNSLRLTIPATSIDLTLDPATKPFDSKSLSLSVATNNPTGYKLMMSSDSTNLIKTSDNTKTIPTLSELAGGYTNDTFETNKWGYKIGAGNYIPFVSGATIAENDTTTNDQSTTLTFATKINYLQPEGEYKMVLNFITVANMVPVYMQYVEDSMCTTTPMLVVDNRDNQEYIIQRLADGNCWMMNDLNLGATDLTTDLTSKNTNINDTISAADFNSWRSNEWDTSKENQFMTIEGIDPIANEKYGTRYNYNTATLGGNTSATEYDVPTSICPRGWRFPTAMEQYTLKEKYKDKTYEEWRAPISEGGLAFTYPGSYIHYLSSSDNGYYLGYLPALAVSETEISSSGNTNNSTGGLIRCVIKTDYKSLADITNMQEVNKDVVINTPNGTIATLTDIRDNKTYTVRKVETSIWMTQNLRFIGTEIDPTTTNIDTAKSLTYYQLDSDSCNSTDRDGNGMYNLCIKEGVDENNDPTVWYNYAAASAGTIAGEENTEDAIYSLCPKGWELGVTHISYTTDENKISIFNPVGGGYYEGGTLRINPDSWRSFWWSRFVGDGMNPYTRNGTTQIKRSNADGDYLFGGQGVTQVRYIGAYVRCEAFNYTH